MELKQGDVGDLNRLSNQELQELLKRQENILKNSRFVSRLPDKGEKIELFKKKLLDELNQRENVDEAAEMLERMNLQASEQLAEGASLLDDEKTSLKCASKSPFKPFESLRSKTVPLNLQRPRVTSSSLKGNFPKSEAHKVVEYSNVVSPLGKYEKTIVLPLDESQKLLIEQKEKYEDLQAEHAAERLAERMHLTLGDYTPQEDDAYRETEVVSSGEEEETGGTADMTDLIDET